MTTKIALVLDGLGLVAGSVLDFTEEEGKMLVRKVIRENPISEAVKGQPFNPERKMGHGSARIKHGF